MSRLYDRIARYGFECADEAQYPGVPAIAEVVLASLPLATVIAADNVAEYYFEAGTKDWHDWRYADVPNVAPVVDIAFVEYQTKRPLPNGGISHGPAVGVLLLAHELAPGDDYVLFTLTEPAVAEGPCRWMALAIIFEDRADHPALIGHASYGIADDGRIANFRRGAPGAAAEYHWGKHALEAGMPADTVKAWPFFLLRARLFPALLALSFAHCKNVTMREVVPPPKLVKAHQRRHGHGLVTYRVLDIDPMREVLRTEGQAGEVGLKRALHICRGHFAHYTAERPLFGRVTGTIWKPMHIRGEKREGMVVKDYSVKAPT